MNSSLTSEQNLSADRVQVQVSSRVVDAPPHLVFFMYSFMGVILILCNGLTVATVCLTPDLRTLNNRHMVNLAVVDLLMGVSSVIESFAILPATKEAFDKNGYLCIVFFISLPMTNAFESQFCLLLIAFDRLLYLVYPFKYDACITDTSTKISIALSWMIALCLGAVPIYWNTYTGQQDAVCSSEDMVNTVYIWQFFPISMLTVITLSVCFYGRILVMARQQRRVACEVSVGTFSPYSEDVTTSVRQKSAPERPSSPGSHRESRQNQTELATYTGAVRFAKPAQAVAEGTAAGPSSRIDVDNRSGEKRDIFKRESFISNTSKTPTSEAAPKGPKTEHSVTFIQVPRSTCGTQEPRRRTLRRRSRRSLHMFFLINMHFAVLWTPYLVLGLLLKPVLHISSSVRNLLWVFVYFSSGVNFFIYSWKSAEFQRAYKRVLRISQ